MELNLDCISSTVNYSFRILSDVREEVVIGSIDSGNVVVEIPEDKKERELELIIENSILTGSNKKSFLYFVLFMLASICGSIDSFFLGDSLTYICRFKLLEDSTITFNKYEYEAFDFRGSSVTILSQKKILYKKNYRKWLIYSLILFETIAIFLAVIVGWVLKKYWIIVTIIYLIVNTIFYIYATKIKDRCDSYID